MRQQHFHSQLWSFFKCPSYFSPFWKKRFLLEFEFSTGIDIFNKISFFQLTHLEDILNIQVHFSILIKLSYFSSEEWISSLYLQDLLHQIAVRRQSPRPIPLPTFDIYILKSFSVRRKPGLLSKLLHQGPPPRSVRLRMAVGSGEFCQWRLL